MSWTLHTQPHIATDRFFHVFFFRQRPSHTSLRVTSHFNKLVEGAARNHTLYWSIYGRLFDMDFWRLSAWHGPRVWPSLHPSSERLNAISTCSKLESTTPMPGIASKRLIMFRMGIMLFRLKRKDFYCWELKVHCIPPDVNNDCSSDNWSEESSNGDLGNTKPSEGHTNNHGVHAT